MRLIGSAVLAIGLTVVVGWVADLPGLTKLVPAGTPMVINAALGMMLCGGCLLALGQGWRRLGLAGGVLVAAGAWWFSRNFCWVGRWALTNCFGNTSMLHRQ